MINKNEHTEEFGVAAAGVMREVKHTKEFKFVHSTHLSYSQPRLFFWDPWFGSVNVAYYV